MAASHAVALKGGWTLEVSVLDDATWRVLYIPPDGLRMDRTWSVIAKDGRDCPREGFDRRTLGGRPLEPITVVGNSLRHGSIRCDIDPETHKLSWYRDEQWIAGDRAFGDGLRGVDGASVDAGGGRALEHFMTAHDDDWICGLGDKTGLVNQMGCRFRLAARDALGFQEGTDPLYKHWPFWHVRTGDQFYAQLYLNHAEGWAEFGVERSGYYIQPGVTYRRWQADGGDLDYVMFFGRNPQQNLERFYALTGAPLVRPEWACGFQFTSMAIPDSDDPDTAIDDLLAGFEAHDIPISAFHFGSGYSRHGDRRMAMVWDRTRFPEPKQTLAKIKGAGLSVAANIKPSIFEDHPEREALNTAGAFVTDASGAPVSVRNWDGPAALIDYSSDAGWRWWRDAARDRILSTGIDVIWNDNNEYELWDADATCAGFGAPMRFQDFRTAQSLLMCRASLEAQEAGNRRERHSITRSAVPGCQRYAETWSGDNFTSWDGLRASIDQTNVMALSGLPVTGHDVGGFYGPSPSPELLVRYVQAYCLLPRMVMNSWKPDSAITVPWLHDSVIEPVRAAIKLRHRLLPQLMKLERQGRWLRAPQQQFPSDERLFADGCSAFMVGDWLVAPVVEEGATTRSVYLPRHSGGWRDWQTHEDFGPGGEVVEVPVTLNSIPVFEAIP